MHSRTLLLLGLLAASKLAYGQLPDSPHALKLSQVENLALEQDSVAQQFSAQQQSLLAEGQAQAQLPDPMLKLGIANMPVDSFSLDQDPMTQLNLGLSQTFARGDSLTIKEKTYGLRSEQVGEQAQLRQLEVKQAVRSLWFNIRYRVKAQELLQQKQQIFRQNLDNMVSGYTLGRSQSQDLIQAELELDRLEEKITANAQQEQQYRASLSRWIGSSAYQPLADKLPDWSGSIVALSSNQTSSERSISYEGGSSEGISSSEGIHSEQIIPLLLQHPGLKITTTGIRVQQQQLALAENAYQPVFKLDMNYGHRRNELNGSRRPDLLSVFVTMDLPLFADKKQDQQYKSKIHSISAAEAQRDDRLQQYLAKFSNALSQLQFIQQRLSLYQEKLLPQAKAQNHSTEQAYQSNTTSFDRLTQSYIGELTLALEYQKLLTDQALIESQIRFFQAL